MRGVSMGGYVLEREKNTVAFRVGLLVNSYTAVNHGNNPVSKLCITGERERLLRRSKGEPAHTFSWTTACVKKKPRISH